MEDRSSEGSRPVHRPVRGVCRVAALGFVLWSLPKDALAYIDPGSGTLIVQAILSGVFGFIFIARKAIARVGARLFGKKETAPVSAADEPSQPSSRA